MSHGSAERLRDRVAALNRGDPMRRGEVEPARHAVTLRGRSRRGLAERLYLQFPSTVGIATRVTWRLPPRSRLRRALLRHVVQVGFDAINRGDFESAFILFHPEGELVTPPTLVELGFDPVYRGRTARFEFQRRWTAEWGEMRFEPHELIDLGDRLLYLGRFHGSGLTSGAGFDSEWGLVHTVSAGRVVREQPFFDQQAAREAAGLR